MATTKSKTFADRMRAEAREIDGQSWQFGISMVKTELEEQLIEGLKAFAKLWFLELTDETDLPVGVLPAQGCDRAELVDI